MFVALLWFCTRLLCASLSTHQSCVKDTLASRLNMHFFQISNVSEITFVLSYSFKQSVSELLWKLHCSFLLLLFQMTQC